MRKHDCPQCGQDMRLPPDAHEQLAKLDTQEVRELRTEIEMLRRHLERVGWKPLRDGDLMTLQKIEGGKAP